MKFNWSRLGWGSLWLIYMVFAVPPALFLTLLSVGFKHAAVGVEKVVDDGIFCVEEDLYLRILGARRKKD